MGDELEIKNAIITGATITNDDHGLLSAWVHLDYGGSGTTAIAAHKAKRNFIVIEKEQKYFDLATRRLANERT